MDVLVLGCGFTGRRVAERFLSRGARVTVTSRQPERLAGLGATAVTLDEVGEHLRRGVMVVQSIPPEGPWREALDLLGDSPARVVYLSSTAVYGAAKVVDAETPVDCVEARARVRLEAEQAVAAGPWSWLILRAAAIYGPGRGAHESFQRGTYVAGQNVVSRIHVDDLAAHVEAGLLSDVCGAFPVADGEPCTSHEVADFCERVMGLKRGTSDRKGRDLGDRRVDGSAIRRVLGIGLIYPSYRTGIPAALAATEKRGEQ